MATQLLRLTAVLALFWGIPVWSQLPPRARLGPGDHFPLAVGNQWVYVTRGFAPGAQLTVEVTATAQFNGITYFELSEFARQRAWVRRTANGEIVQYDPAGGPEKLWYVFGAAEGFSWRSQLPVDCIDRATIRQRSAEVRVSAGVFSPSLMVSYPPSVCADAGLIEEAFAPGVGLVRRSEQTIGGPRSYELAYARIGGTTIAGPELSFSLAIDRPVYFADFMPPVDPARSVPVLTARLTVRNSSALPLTLHFNTSQQYDLIIRDESGRQVFLWSEGRAFLQVLTQIELSPGEKTFLIEVRLADRDGRTFPAGRYTAEAVLTTREGILYFAKVPFELRHVF